MLAFPQKLLIFALALMVGSYICVAEEVQDGENKETSIRPKDPTPERALSELLDNQLSEYEIDRNESLSDGVLSLSLKKTWSEERKGMFGTVNWNRENDIRLRLVRIEDNSEKYLVVFLEEYSKYKAPIGRWRVAHLDSDIIKDTVKTGHIVKGQLLADKF